MNSKLKRRRTYNERLVKTCRSYTIQEAARLLGAHENTVRCWIVEGLPIIRKPRPAIILGRELRPFLKDRKKAKKCPSGKGEIFCVRCRCARTPAGLMADYEPKTATSGDLIGLCPVCDALMYRRVNYARLGEVRGELDVRQPEARKHIDESDQPSVNCDFKRA